MSAPAAAACDREVCMSGRPLVSVSHPPLAADTRRGTRASFTRAAAPAKGNEYFELFLKECASRLPKVEKGVFGANMQVSLTNDGPVTFWLEA